ncbi:MAG: hypothetical protein LM550_13080 [Candidatus Contendobacter sp.]|nr:hypothetical protein [Gammaproteobacteria bacterium]MCC8994590.1 hypothetical protein [Candidatus Contendobacter sp.]
MGDGLLEKLLLNAAGGYAGGRRNFKPAQRPLLSGLLLYRAGSIADQEIRHVLGSRQTRFYR